MLLSCSRLYQTNTLKEEALPRSKHSQQANTETLATSSQMPNWKESAPDSAGQGGPKLSTSRPPSKLSERRGFKGPSTPPSTHDPRPGSSCPLSGASQAHKPSPRGGAAADHEPPSASRPVSRAMSHTERMIASWSGPLSTYGDGAEARPASVSSSFCSSQPTKPAATKKRIFLRAAGGAPRQLSFADNGLSNPELFSGRLKVDMSDEGLRPKTSVADYGSPKKSPACPAEYKEAFESPTAAAAASRPVSAFKDTAASRPFNSPASAHNHKQLVPTASSPASGPAAATAAGTGSKPQTPNKISIPSSMSLLETSTSMSSTNSPGEWNSISTSAAASLRRARGHLEKSWGATSATGITIESISRGQMYSVFAFVDYSKTGRLTYSVFETMAVGLGMKPDQVKHFFDL
eukprot:gene9812-7701_t